MKLALVSAFLFSIATIAAAGSVTTLKCQASGSAKTTKAEIAKSPIASKASIQITDAGRTGLFSYNARSGSCKEAAEDLNRYTSKKCVILSCK